MFYGKDLTLTGLLYVGPGLVSLAAHCSLGDKDSRLDFEGFPECFTDKTGESIKMEGDTSGDLHLIYL